MYEQKIIENLRKYSAKYQYEDQKLSETCFRAADAIEELQAQLPKWIPVTERLPETDNCVLVISYGRVCFAKLLLTKNNGGYPTFVLQDGLNNPPVLETTAHNEFTKNRITHWMPLPEPPKEETDG